MGALSKQLSTLHAHARDARIRFYDEGHRYIILDKQEGRYVVDGNFKRGSYRSVTTVAGSGFKPFESEKIAHDIATKGSPGNYYYGLTKEQILHIWVFRRDAGTIIHKRAEDYVNGLWTFDDAAKGLPNCDPNIEREHFRAFLEPWPELAPYYNGRWTKEDLEAGTLSLLSPDLEHLIVFLAEHPHLKPYRTEWFVFDEELAIMGAIDMVFWDERLQAYVIYDWKRARKMRMNAWGNKTGDKTYSYHVPDTNYWHYCVQLMVYKLILERNYGMYIAEMWLVGLDPQQESYTKYQVRWDDAQIRMLIAARLCEIADHVQTEPLRRFNITLDDVETDLSILETIDR